MTQINSAFSLELVLSWWLSLKPVFSSPKTLWQDVGVKSSPIFSKSCPKGNVKSKRCRSSQYPKNIATHLGYFCKELCSQEYVKNHPIWSHWRWKRQKRGWRLLIRYNISESNHLNFWTLKKVLKFNSFSLSLSLESFFKSRQVDIVSVSKYKYSKMSKKTFDISSKMKIYLSKAFPGQIGR